MSLSDDHRRLGAPAHIVRMFEEYEKSKAEEEIDPDGFAYRHAFEKTYTFSDRTVRGNEWTGWFIGSNGWLFNCLCDGVYTHNLQAHPNEPNPDANHVHFKFRTDKNRNSYDFVVCSVKTDGMREINRRELIESVNRDTGLGLSYH